VIISLRHAFYADVDGVDYLGEIVEVLKKKNEHIIITGINKEIEKHIHKTNFYKRKLIEGKIYNRTSEAIADIVSK
jgi:anti-anti-sigma regulatory factor